MEILGKLFGSNHIIKILRLFLFNPNATFEYTDILRKTKVPEEIVRVERNMLERIGLIKRRTFYKEVQRKRGNRRYTAKKRVLGWGIDPNFSYLEPLTRFFIDTATIDSNVFLKKIRKAGTPRIVLMSGFFAGDIESINGGIDILIVGDHIKEKKIIPILKDIEAEMGKEIRYAIFSTKDFRYRMEIRDRLVRDVLDYPHKTILDKLGVAV